MSNSFNKKTIYFVLLFAMVLTHYLLATVWNERCLSYVTCNPDERNQIINVRQFLKTDNLNPKTFNHPGHFEAAILYWYFESTGKKPTHRRLIQSGRRLVALFSVIAFISIGWIIYHVTNRFSLSILGMLVYTASITINEYSRLFRADVIVASLVIVSFVFIFLSHKRNNLFLLGIAGFILGLATTSKYPAIVMTLSIGSFVLFFKPSIELRVRFIGLGMSVVGYFFGILAGSPYFFNNIGKILDALKWESRSRHYGADRKSFFERIDFYIDSICADFGYFFCLLFI